MADGDGGRDTDRRDGVLDETLLREVATRLGALTRLDSVSVFPREKPESVVAAFDLAYYPDRIDRVALELRAYVGGEFHVTYRDEWNGQAWTCRWDRHDNPHDARDHVHRPPAARPEDAVDCEFPPDLFAVLELVLDRIDDRLAEVWDGEPTA
jgi:hypothetical protein